MIINEILQWIVLIYLLWAMYHLGNAIRGLVKHAESKDFSDKVECSYCHEMINPGVRGWIFHDCQKAPKTKVNLSLSEAIKDINKMTSDL